MTHPFLTVVIPCYNERRNLESGVLTEIEKYLSHQKYTSEVIISDDESTDGSLELIQKISNPRFRVLKNRHGGKSFALRSGLQEAKGKYTLFTDMDQSTPITEVAKLLSQVDQGSHVVIGSRGMHRKNFSFIRKLASYTFVSLRRIILLPHIHDTQCGFKLVDTHLGTQIFSKMMIFSQNSHAKGWTVAAWDVEFLFLAEKFGYPVAEVPVVWEDNDLSTSKNRTTKKFIHESLDMLKQIIRVRLNDLKGQYA